MTEPRLVLLGPQRFQPAVRDTMRALGVAGPVAVVTAGWQERESEDDELREHLGCEVIDLLLYRRHDDVLLRDRQLAQALGERQQRLRRLQDLYRLRLAHALAAARELMARTDEDDLLEADRSAAIHSVRNLDRRHLRIARRIHEEFDERWQPQRRRALMRHVEQIARILERAGALAVAGGHVAVLLNRMRLFRLGELAQRIPVVAWSAGAMAVTDRVVLFHDSPPQGAGNPEILDAGLGLCRGVVALPHARRRLRLQDHSRVALFARRFAPASCVVLEIGSRLDWDGARWQPGPGTLGLGRGGGLAGIPS